ncbi:hypothetical protein V1512DRAFT_273968 [Lipomyces arxii]|uniref:uncharacterized protein n=1 Tax=Lipomyces arxii TaxID=56418 RepID=UPI0034CF3740
MSPLSTAANAVFSSVLFIACSISAILAYRWAVAPILDYYNITINIPLRDISTYIHSLQPGQRPSGNEIALLGPDELESGVGITNLGRRNVTETRKHSKWEKRVRWVDQIEADDDADEFFDVSSIAGNLSSTAGSVGSVQSTNGVSAVAAAQQLGGMRT